MEVTGQATFCSHHIQIISEAALDEGEENFHLVDDSIHQLVQPTNQDSLDVNGDFLDASYAQNARSFVIRGRDEDIAQWLSRIQYKKIIILNVISGQFQL